MNVQEKYGLDPTGQTDNSFKLAQMAADVAGVFRAGQPQPSLVFSAGTYKFSQWPNLAYPYLRLKADGEVRFLGNVVFDGRVTYPGIDEPGPNGLQFEGFDVPELTVIACHRSRFDVRAQSVLVQFSILTEFRLVVHGGGVVLDALPSKPNLQTTACLLMQPIIEGCNTGLWLKNAGVTTAIGGSIESCNIGIKIESACGNTRVLGTDLEGNKEWDIYDQGHSNDFDVASGLKWWHSLPFGL